MPVAEVLSYLIRKVCSNPVYSRSFPSGHAKLSNFFYQQAVSSFEYIICILRRPHRMEITIAVILSMQPCFSLNIMFQAVRGGGILLRFYSLLAPLTIIKESFFLPLNGRGIPQRYRICTAVFQSGWPSLRSH